MGGDFHHFHLELERIRLQVMALAESRATSPNEETLARTHAEQSGVSEALKHLASGRAAELVVRLDLQPVDLDLLWTAVAIGSDPSLVAHVRALGGDPRRGLSLALYAAIAQLEPLKARTLAHRLLAGNHPLLAERMLEWSTEPHTPSTRGLVVPPRVIAWLAGGDRVEPSLEIVKDSELALDTEQRIVLEALPALLRTSPPPMVIIEGPIGSGRRTAVAHAARINSRAAIVLDASRVSADLPTLEATMIALRRECVLGDAIPIVAELDSLGHTDAERRRALHVVAQAIDDMRVPAVVTVRDSGAQIVTRRPLARVRWSVPDAATRRSLWQRSLADDAPNIAGLDETALRYRMGAGGIQRAVQSARLAAGDQPLSTPHVVTGVRTHIAEQLGELAVRQDVKQSWDDLVLAPDIADQVTMLVARVRHAYQVLEEWGFSARLPKGTGVAALFSGPPGTGKTMVAGLIARELDLELYQVDLSKVVSKWVGETEKQLARIFEAADAGHALLLFDEADALFAKRTDVKSAVDRYANLEVNYLLQRIESFGGVSILTTNLEASIDPALRRRLAATIAFWPPDQQERERLWNGMLSSRAPTATDINVRKLADAFDEMTGANIRNAVLAAAFLAAAEGSAITQHHLERAARGEYASMGRILGKK
jgi:hypothetical protein